MERTKPASVDAYINNFPPSTQVVLQRVRTLIRETVPEAAEGISYAIPAYRARGRCFIYFAGYKKHIGMYPVPSGVPELDAAYAAYKTSGKGAIQFPLDRPLPEDLIRKIVLHKYSTLPG